MHLLVAPNKIYKEVSGACMKIEDLKYSDITKEIVDKVLFEGLEYTGEEAVIAIVPGSNRAAKYRVPVAAELYLQQKVKKLFMCGGNKFAEDGIVTEAEAMKKKAMELGVKEEDILIETKSETTKENIINALTCIKRYYDIEKLDKIILVTTSFHMRRSILLAKKYFPKHICFIPCPAEDIRTNRNSWYKNKVGYERAVGEVIGIVDYAKQNEIESFEI